MAYIDLIPASTDRTGPFKFEVVTGAWKVPYEATIHRGRLHYKCTGPSEIKVKRGRSETALSKWFYENGLILILSGDQIIEGNKLYKPKSDVPPYDRSSLTPFDWTGTDIKKESQRAERRVDSIQYRAIAELKQESWDIVLDDDGTGEIADVVALKIDGDELLIRFVHCKYSHGATPGRRLEDLYELCGQAQKSIIWRRGDLMPFFRTLERRARRKQKREGVSPFEVGDIRKLYRLQEESQVKKRRMEIVLVQPGVSASRATDQQLELLASTESYLRTTINAPLRVWCSS